MHFMQSMQSPEFFLLKRRFEGSPPALRARGLLVGGETGGALIMSTTLYKEKKTMVDDRAHIC